MIKSAKPGLHPLVKIKFMIYVNRNKVDPPRVLVIEGGLGYQETQKVIAHFSNPVTAKLPFKDFLAYKNEEVKNLLFIIFNQKCAYCETRFAAAYTGDIDHFRPKGKVVEKLPGKKKGTNINKVLSKNGYYWMAAKWDNLVLSCKDCNSARRHKLPDNSEIVIGKQEQFPLIDETYRIKQPDVGELESEESARLIVNPCTEDPEKFFEYDEGMGVIKERQGLIDKALLKARKSIDVYALHRSELCDERKRMTNAILERIESCDSILQLYNRLSSIDQDRPENKQMIQNERNKLVQLVQSDQMYAGLARQIIGKYFKLKFNLDIRDFIK